MRYIIMFAINLIVSLPMMTIHWFTWQAWIGVALVLTLYYWFQITNADNLEEMSNRECRRLDEINVKLDKLIDFTKRNVSNSDAANEKIIDELKKIRKTVRHEVKNL